MTNISDHKKAYLDYKEKLLADIKYYEKSIEEFRANDKNNNYYDDNSSDSEEDWLCPKDTVPKAVELRRQQAKLRTYLQATQELTGLTVLQFEVNVLVQDPDINGKPPVCEPGTWREVTAECRADLVPFSITFYVHTPDRKFGQLSYRGVRVVLVKAPHDAELAHSALHALATPSDAVEVLRSYAAAYRARRTTLAHLANKYTNTLHMEPHKEGGFVFKCANLLEVVWRLENKWSSVAPFHHKMKFDLEYMDESYIKTISQCHKQLSNPSLQTDERTLILAKIITTCLEARGPEPPESVESDLESKTTDCDLKRDSEVMAPPKTIPKKAKAKNAANTAQKRSNDGSKRMKSNDNDENARNVPDEAPRSISNRSKRMKNNDNDENAGNVPNIAQKSSSNNGSKRMRTNDNDENAKNMPNTAQKGNINEGSKGMRSNDNNDNTENNDNVKNIPNTAPKRSINDNNSVGSKRMKSNDIKNVKDTGNTVTAKVIQNKDSNTDNINKDSNTKNKTDKTKKSIATAKNSANVNPKTNEVNQNAVANAKNVNSNKTKTVNTKISSNSKDAKKPDISTNAKNKTDKTKDKNEATTKNLISSSKEKTADGGNSNNEANTKNKQTKDKNKTQNAANTTTASIKDTNKINNIVAKNKDKNNIKNVANAKNGSDSANNENIPQNSNAKNAIAKPNSVAKTKNDNKVANSKNLANNDSKSNANIQENNENIPKNTVKKVTEKNIATTRNKDKIANINGPKPQEKILSGNLNNKFSRNMSLRTGNIKSSIFKAGNTEKENDGRVSKIPQKKLTPISEKSLKPNPLRISPRTFPSKFKTLSNKNIAKITNIPILKKSVSKQ